jgi:predicted nucleic acid-binding protein
VTLTDTGPLIALIDKADRDHSRCVTALDDLDAPLISTWPVFTEACYLLGDRVGWEGQEALWRLVLRDDLQLVDLSAAMRGRSRDLMAQYRDLPMDLADASLVALAEAKRLRRVFTLDDDFRVYRLPPGRRAFDVVP